MRLFPAQPPPNRLQISVRSLRSSYYHRCVQEKKASTRTRKEFSRSTQANPNRNSGVLNGIKNCPLPRVEAQLESRSVTAQRGGARVLQNGNLTGNWPSFCPRLSCSSNRFPLC